MSSRSISRRVYRAILAVSIVSMVAMVSTVHIVNEDLERTMLDVEFSQERDYILMNHSGDDVHVWDTPNLVIVFVPPGKPRPDTLPPVFHGLPDSDYSAEIEFGEETYLVTIKNADNGLFYIAKNITHFENREALFNIALAIMTLIILAFSLLLAALSSRRVVRPLKLLSERISRIPVGPNMPRMESDYAETELHAIATTFNRFLDELESYVRREQSLLSLASHELRTPIAVMSGALDIIESRGQLASNDRATLERVRRSCDEMRNNVDVLLKLARHESSDPLQETVDLQPAMRRVIDDLKVSHKAGDRITLDARSSPTVRADPIMVHMLLRNLVQNAVQHTQNDIRVALSDAAIEIEDQGTGLTPGQQAILRGEDTLATDGSTLSGLGLYIVTLMAERLDWKLDITRTDRNGTRIRLVPKQ